MINTIKSTIAKVLFDFSVMTAVLYSIPALLFGMERTNAILMEIGKDIINWL